MKRIISALFTVLIIFALSSPAFASRADYEDAVKRIKESYENTVNEFSNDDTVQKFKENYEDVINEFSNEDDTPSNLPLIISFVIASLGISYHYIKNKRSDYRYTPDTNNIEQEFSNIINAVKAGLNSTSGGYSSKIPSNGNHYNSSYDANQHMMDEMTRQFNQQALDFSMEEARKAATPFDHGGYQQGYGINPSDTMAGDMHNNMNNMGGMGF